VAGFLSSEWFADLNRSLNDADPAPLEPDASTFRIVLELPDAPDSLPRALTLTMSAEGASVAPGDHPGADALVRLSYADALALSEGHFDSATALREGRVKVRGDVSAIVPLLGWLQASHRPLEQ
jgi:putative sterol carrier protein